MFCNCLRFRRPEAGFTLIELMVTVALVAILASVAMPSYADFVRRAKVPPALTQLTIFWSRMEQRYQDRSSYGTNGCSLAPGSVAGFTFSCSLTGEGRGFVATAIGQGSMEGYAYSIDQNGNQRTVSHPKGVPNAACWSMKGAVCDS